jgi:hypothetical protein
MKEGVGELDQAKLPHPLTMGSVKTPDTGSSRYSSRMTEPSDGAP